jgi:hypothetical protein
MDAAATMTKSDAATAITETVEFQDLIEDDNASYSTAEFIDLTQDELHR